MQIDREALLTECRHQFSRRRLVQAAPLAVAALSASTHSRSAAAVDSLILSPQPGTKTAFPGTTIAIRGATSADVGVVQVTGSRSGGHTGLLIDHPDGNGCSWIPDDEFFGGELITVAADIPLMSSKDDEYTFRLAHPARRIFSDTDKVADDPPGGDDAVHSWKTHPDWLAPNMKITDRVAGASVKTIMLSSNGTDAQSAVMIVDDSGETVWYSPSDLPYYQRYCLKPGTYRDEPVIAFAESTASLGYGFGHWNLLNQSYEQVGRIQAGNGIPGLDVHDIVLTDRGTAYCAAYPPVYRDLTELGGEEKAIVLDCTIQEIDIETGIVYFEWHTLDHIDMAESARTPPDDAETPFDYTHINSIELMDNGNLLLSGRHVHALYQIDTTTGEIVWRLGGKQSDFKMGEGTDYAFQHDARSHGDGIYSVFDNYSDNQDDNGEKVSRGLLLKIDEEAMTAEVDREYIHPTGILSVSQGNLTLRDDGSVFVGWGSAPVYSTFDADGGVIYNARFPDGIQSYRAYDWEWTGTPTDPPVAVASLGNSGFVDLAVSWNGSTETAFWRVSGSDGSSDPVEIDTFDRDGFETQFSVETDASVLHVAALDANGRVLGEAEPVEVATA